ncbi:MAG: aldo/keto reductase [Planctomycetes bacterium]|nr:aldo/keto reductase [Planctomycetota bacterium]
MPRRVLGKTGQKVSLLCVGGHHIGRPDEATAIRIIQEAVDAGATFMDNAWEYHGGASEERMGKALKGRRDKVFLMTKHHGRDKATAMGHLEDSLRRLGTDVIDLWQFHEIVYDADPDMIFAPGGGIEAADLAKKQGKVRYVGFTGHKHPQILLKMLAYEYPWDAVQMPLNILDGSFQSFEKWVLPVLVRRGIGVLAMKTRSSGAMLREKAATAEECWRYVTGLPVSTVVSGMESLELLRDNLRMARTLKPMSPEEMEAARQRTREAALKGAIERYKTSTAFDGPVGRKLHGV